MTASWFWGGGFTVPTDITAITTSSPPPRPRCTSGPLSLKSSSEKENAMAQSSSAKKLAGRAGPFVVKAPSKGRPSGSIPDHGFKIMEPVGVSEIMDNSAQKYADPTGQLMAGRGRASMVTLPKE